MTASWLSSRSSGEVIPASRTSLPGLMGLLHQLDEVILTVLAADYYLSSLAQFGVDELV